MDKEIKGLATTNAIKVKEAVPIVHTVWDKSAFTVWVMNHPRFPPERARAKVKIPKEHRLVYRMNQSQGSVNNLAPGVTGLRRSRRLRCQRHNLYRGGGSGRILAWAGPAKAQKGPPKVPGPLAGG